MSRVTFLKFINTFKFQRASYVWHRIIRKNPILVLIKCIILTRVVCPINTISVAFIITI